MAEHMNARQACMDKDAQIDRLLVFSLRLPFRFDLKLGVRDDFQHEKRQDGDQCDGQRAPVSKRVVARRLRIRKRNHLKIKLSGLDDQIQADNVLNVFQRAQAAANRREQQQRVDDEPQGVVPPGGRFVLQVQHGLHEKRHHVDKQINREHADDDDFPRLAVDP